MKVTRGKIDSFGLKSNLNKDICIHLTEFEKWEFENLEFENSEFENLELKIENVSELYASRQTTFVLVI